MSNYKPTREDALELFKEFNKTDSLYKHALAVEATMKHFAELLGEEDIEKWSVIGLIHDLDFEMYPEQHCTMTKEILQERNWPEDYIRTVLSHGWGLCTDVEPVETIDKVLYTIDELTGLVAATALMRPSKSIMDMEAKSVKKKWKQKSFAAGVDRSIIENGAEMLEMDLNTIIAETIKGMRTVADEIGLNG
ncbi:MAG: HDIG domain-containing protein [Spirochaetales bacterium]|nr:HDIG domain-containing protein [Spirochaetales bacterium]